MNEQLRKLLEARAAAFTTAQDGLSRAERDNGGEDAQARESFEAAFNEVRELDARIAEVRSLIASEASAEEARSMLGDMSQQEQREQVDGFRSFLRGESDERGYDLGFSEREQRGLATGANGSTASNGEGNLLATTLVATLYEGLRDTSIIRRLASSFTTTGGESIQFPKVGQRPTASRVNEGGLIGTSDPTFTKDELKAFKYAFIAKLNREMVDDPIVNLVPFIVSFGREALFDAQAADWLNGTGANQPEGLVPGLTKTKTAASGSAISADEMLSLKFGIKAGYRSRGVYVVNSTTGESLAKLKGTDGHYLWKTSARDGEPDVFHGRPIYTDEGVPNIGLSARSAVFIDPARAYLIRDVGTVRVDRSDEYGFDTDEVAWRFIVRSDGGVWDDEAGIALVHPAT